MMGVANKLEGLLLICCPLKKHCNISFLFLKLSFPKCPKTLSAFLEYLERRKIINT